MANSFFNLHTYLIFNGAITFGYIFSRLIIRIFFLTKKTSQSQSLYFARYSFIAAAVVFFLMPVISAIIPFAHHSGFQLTPILKSASVTFLQHHEKANKQFTTIDIASTFLISRVALIAWFIGFGLFLEKYINSIFALKKLRKHAFCQHKINNVEMLFCNTIETSFCWSFIKKHFIALPYSLLEKNNDLKLAIRHGLQHIRQADTHWLHFLSVIKIFCFWNPFIFLWIKWMDELQEFSCDESMILRKKTSPAEYAQCLINAASDSLIPQGVLGINHLSQSILYRRISMLFNYKKTKIKKASLILAYIICFFSVTSIAYAFERTHSFAPLTAQQLASIIKHSKIDNGFHVTARPEVVSEINKIRSSEQARSFLQDSLQRMKLYQSNIQTLLKQNNMPKELLVIPLIESGYQPLDQSKNPVLAAGIWQIIPDTAIKFGLVINSQRDDRLNATLATKAALAYLQKNHDQFKNWKLACIAYEIGEKNTAQLIQDTQSRDPWVLAESRAAPKSLKNFVGMLDASIIIMNNPSLIK